MTTEQLQYLKKALAFVFSLVEPDEYIGKCPEADYEAINGLIEGEIERQSVTDEEIDRAIRYLEILATDLTGESCKLGLSWGAVDYIERKIRLCDVAIEALKNWQAVRENRTTEPVGESEPCYMCKQIEDKYETEVIIRYAFGDYEDFTPDFCPSCGREL